MELTMEQKIEKMLQDSAKGLAGNKEFMDELTRLVAEDVAKSEALVEAQSKIKLLEEQTVDLNKQVKSLVNSRFRAIKTPEGLYRGVWGDLQTAKAAGMFVLASVAKHGGARKWLEDNGYEFKKDTEKAMGEEDITSGGALVPSELIPNIILLIEQYGVFRQNVMEYPMASSDAQAPKIDSGLTVYCPGAGVAPTASDLSTSVVGMNARKWMTLTAIDSELNEDSAIALGELIGRMVGMAFAQKEDQVGFLGDGTSTYFGHVGISGALKAVDGTIGNIKSLVVGTGNAYSELTLVNHENLVGQVPAYADNGELAWYVNRKYYYTVMVKLAMAAGGANATEILTGSASRDKTFLGYPVKFAQAMPSTEANSQVCAVFGNLRMGAYLGDRRRLTIDQSREAYFTTDQLGIRGTERVAPSVYGVGDTSNPGPICGLITAAS